MSSSTLRDVYQAHYSAVGMSIKTMASHRSNLSRWERLTSNPPVTDVVTSTIEAYRSACLADGKTNDSAESGLITVMMVLNLARRVGLVDRVPWPGRRLRRRQEPKYVPPLADLGKLYAHADAAGWPRGMDRQRFWRAILCVGYWTGIRMSDLFFRLSWDAVTADGIFLVANKTGKRHAFPMSPVVRRHLDMVSNWSEDRVFPVGRSNKQILRSFHELSRSAGVRPITAQAIRRLSATQWQKARWGAGEVIQGSAIRGSAKLYIVPQLLQQAGPLMAWPDEMLLPEERDERRRQETQIVETFKRLGPMERQTVLALADRLAS